MLMHADTDAGMLMDAAAIPAATFSTVSVEQEAPTLNPMDRAGANTPEAMRSNEIHLGPAPGTTTTTLASTGMPLARVRVKRAHTIDWGALLAEGRADADTLIIEVENGGCLELCTADNTVASAARYIVIEGQSRPRASPWTGYKLQWPQQHPPRVIGAIRSLLGTCPNLQFLELRCCEYAVDWADLDAADSLQSIDLWDFEDLTCQIRFPKNCVVNLHGLATHYKRDPDAVMTFLTCALAVCTEWAWNIGYYDTAHQSMLATLKAIKRQNVQGQGRDQEQLDLTMHVTPNPPNETELA